MEPLRIQQQLSGGVVVLLEDRVDLLEEGFHRLRLGLGGGLRAAVGLRARVGGAAVVVTPPVRAEVAVGVDAVVAVDDVVVVVVGQVLPPEAMAGGERVLVAVGVVHAYEPQLGRVDQLGDLFARAGGLAVVVDEVLEGAPAGLAGQPLTRVLHRVVEDGRAVRDVLARRVLGHLEGGDVAPAVGGARHALGDDVGVIREQAVVLLRVLLLVVALHRVVLRPDRPGGVVGVGGRVDPLLLGTRAVVRDALRAQLRHLAAVGGDVDRPTVEVAPLRHVEALFRQRLKVFGSGLNAVGVE